MISCYTALARRKGTNANPVKLATSYHPYLKKCMRRNPKF